MSEETEMDETIREFLVEAQENMEQGYKDLEALQAILTLPLQTGPS